MNDTATHSGSYEASFMEGGDKSRPSTVRPVIYGLNYVVSSGHWLTSLAASRVLENGGNAFDAVVAATFAAAVVEPTASFSLGAECLYLFRPNAEGQVVSLCGQGPASKQATQAFFTDKRFCTIPTGPGPDASLSFTVPGMIGAAFRLLSDYGTADVSEVLAPAIGFARDGYPCYDYLTSRLTDDALRQFQRFGTKGADIFYPNDRKAAPGTILRQPDLAAVLQQLGDAATGLDRKLGIAAARALFYQGAIADKIAHASECVGGILSREDLSDFAETYEQPAATTFNGYAIQSHGFWSQSPVVLQALNMLEQFDLRSLGHNSADYVHVVTEALKLAFADRESYYGDTAGPWDELLSKDYARTRAQQIDRNTTRPEIPAAGRIDGWPASATTGLWAPNEDEPTGPEMGTTFISVVDGHGNMACAMPSGGAFGKSVFFDDLGFTLSTRSEMLNLVEGHPNCVAPGKRPRTTLTTYFATAPSGTLISFGCPGGEAQAQACLQLILNVLIWGMNPQEAVEAPRFATMSIPNSFYPHAYHPGRLSLESGFDASTTDRLRSLGHRVVSASTCGMGATVTMLDPETGIRTTSADIRRPCHAAGC